MTAGTRISLRNDGFTLVELLVALTIMAMVAGLLGNSMSFSLGTTETVESNIADVESLHQAQRAFRRLVQLARPIVNDDSPEELRLDFAASATRLDFIAPLPGLVMGGLLHRVSMRIDVPGGRVTMVYRPYLDDSQDGDNAFGIDEVTLVEGFSDATFSYLDTLSANAVPWVDEWRHPDRLPDLVRLSLHYDDQARTAPAELIVAIKATVPNRLGAP